MKLLGIDPGSRVTGYGIIQTDGHRHRPIDFGAIRLKATLPFPERLDAIHSGILERIEQHTPEAVILETQFMARNANSALKLGMAKGAALLAATRNRIPIFEYAPTKVKLAVVGTGRGSKHQVQHMTKMLLGLRDMPQPEDAADALAIAICHAHMVTRPLIRGVA